MQLVISKTYVVLLAVSITVLAIGFLVVTASIGLSLVEYSIQESQGLDPGHTPDVLLNAQAAGNVITLIGGVATIASFGALLTELRKNRQLGDRGRRAEHQEKSTPLHD